MRIPQQFTKKEVCDLIGMSPRTNQYYVDEGIVQPGIHNPSGKGVRRIFSAKNVIEFMLIQAMAANGIPLGTIKELFKMAREKGQDDYWDPESERSIKDMDKSLWLVIKDARGKEPSFHIGGATKMKQKAFSSHGGHSALVIPLDDMFATVYEHTRKGR